MTAHEAEALPTGEPDARHEPRRRVCSSCGVGLFHAPHLAGCPELAVIFRLNVQGDPAMRAAEDALQACTNRAVKAARRLRS